MSYDTAVNVTLADVDLRHAPLTYRITQRPSVGTLSAKQPTNGAGNLNPGDESLRTR